MVHTSHVRGWARHNPADQAATQRAAQRRVQTTGAPSRVQSHQIRGSALVNGTHCRRHYLFHIIRMVLGAALAITGIVNIVLPTADAEPALFSYNQPSPLPPHGTTGTLIITKETGEGKPIADATFTATQVTALNQVPLNLTQASGWQMVDDLGIWAAPGEELDPTKLSVPINRVLNGEATLDRAHTRQETTNASGQAVFTGLPVGLYLIEDVTEYRDRAESILVTLPYPDPVNNRWLTEAVATPKPTVPPPYTCEPGMQPADLQADIKIEDNRTTAVVGDRLTYDFVVTNLDDSATATGAKVQITLDPGLKVISDNFPDEFDVATYVWTLPDLAPGESLSLRVLVQVVAVGTHAATMLITAECDPDLSNNYYDPVIQATDPGEPTPPTPPVEPTTPPPTPPVEPTTPPPIPPVGPPTPPPVTPTPGEPTTVPSTPGGTTPTIAPTTPGAPTPSSGAPGETPTRPATNPGRLRGGEAAAVENARQTAAHDRLRKTGIGVFAIVAGSALAFTGYLALRRHSRRRAET